MTGKEIADAVNEIIKSLDPHDKLFENQAVNWSSVRVYEVSKKIEMWPDFSDNNEEIEVCVSEVAPESYKFAKVIADKFHEKYNIDIIVRMEW